MVNAMTIVAGVCASTPEKYISYEALAIDEGEIVKKTMAICGLLAAIIASPAAAKKRVWNETEFTKCMVQLNDPMNPGNGLSTQKCKQNDKVYKDDGDLSDVMLDTFIAAVHLKNGGTNWNEMVTFTIDYKRYQTVLGGNPVAGYADFNKATMLINDKLFEFALAPVDRKVVGCGTVGRGLLSASHCHYIEMVGFQIKPTAIPLFRQVTATQPDGTVRMKLFSSDETFELELSASEVLAVADGITANNGVLVSVVGDASQ